MASSGTANSMTIASVAIYRRCDHLRDARRIGRLDKLGLDQHELVEPLEKAEREDDLHEGQHHPGERGGEQCFQLFCSNREDHSGLPNRYVVLTAREVHEYVFEAGLGRRELIQPPRALDRAVDQRVGRVGIFREADAEQPVAGGFCARDAGDAAISSAAGGMPQAEQHHAPAMELLEP
jgi:hypothetical protein